MTARAKRLIVGLFLPLLAASGMDAVVEAQCSVRVVAGPSFTASGGNTCAVSVVCTRTLDGSAWSGLNLYFDPTEWTYKTYGTTTDGYGKGYLGYGHVRPNASVTLQVTASGPNGQVGSGSCSVYGYESASSGNTFTFSPLNKTSFRCYNGYTGDYLNFYYQSNTYKYSPLGQTVVVSGAPGTGIYCYNNHAAPGNALGQCSFSACQFGYGGPWTVWGYQYINYYTRYGNASYVSAAKQSQTFMITQ